MSSIIEGYEYDIFISYRQKDNKHDGWVTEFVDNLKGELEATFKEDISIYFDENPHDGLLETHSVDKSLEGKLKCLIFIPVISQTYCDPKSYAWQHEFCAFNKLAKEDRFGKDIKIASGNVASRILPVQIHDLDAEDKRFVEDELGGFMRRIEFIYKEPGVNRPLTAKDNEEKNLNKTSYRNQINKVANAIKEIVSAIKHQEQKSNPTRSEISGSSKVPEKNKRVKILTGFSLFLLLVILGILFIPKLIKSKKQLEKSIAVLPFRNDSRDEENLFFINGTMEAILDNLCKINDIRVISRTSVEQYRNSRKSVREIAKELKVNYILEGSGQKYGDRIKLTVQLIDAASDKHLWSGPYERKSDDILQIESEIAQKIASEIKAMITSEEKELIEKKPTENITALELYLKAKEAQAEYLNFNDLHFFLKAVTLLEASLEIDSAFAKAYSTLGFIYYSRYYWENYFQENFLDTCILLANRALKKDEKLDEAYYLKGRCYDAIGNNKEAMLNYDKAIEFNPNYFQAYNAKGRTLTWVLHDFPQGIENYNKAISLSGGFEKKSLLSGLGRAYLDLGFIEKAKLYYREALALDNDSLSYLGQMGWIEFSLENFQEAIRLSNKVCKFDTTIIPDLVLYLNSPDRKEEAFHIAEKTTNANRRLGTLNLVESHRVGYTYYINGRIEEAKYYFNQQIKYGLESIKLDRDIGQRKAAQYDLAGVYAFLGQKDKAYQFLDEFNTMNFYPLWWVSLIKHDPLFYSIRNEERFQTILQNVVLKNRAEHNRVEKWLEEQGVL